MRVDNQIWNYALSGKGKILVSVEYTTCTLLTMSTSKLITDLWNPLRSHLDLSESEPLFIDCEDYLIDLASL